MHRKLKSLCFTLLLILTATTANAGLSEALGQVGTQYADDAATSAGLPYTPSEAIQGIKDILSLEFGSAMTTLGQTGGFSQNSAVALPLPDSLKGLSNASGLLGSLNIAAEKTVPSTDNIFMDAIEQLSITNASSLLGGGEDAITRFFESSSRDAIRKLMMPIVSKSVEAAGVDKYLSAMTAASSVTEPAFDPNAYVTDRTLDGIFHIMALKEKELRATSGAGTTDLIQKLF